MMASRSARSLVATCLLVTATPLLPACGARDTHVALRQDITIAILPEPDRLPFDPRGARLGSATQQLTALLGHPVTFQFDAAVAAAFRDDFERQLIDAIEHTARGLVRWKKDEPDAFARMAAQLNRVECHYRATVTEAAGTFDPAAGAVKIDLPARPRELVPVGVLLDALADADDAHRDARFAEQTPETVPPADRRAYFDYLTRTRPGYGSLYERRFRAQQKSLSRADQLAQSPHARVVTDVVRLHELAKSSDADLTARTRAWLLGQVETFFHNAYGSQRADAAAAPEGSPFRRAEAAYGAWLGRIANGASSNMTVAERLEIATHVYDSFAPTDYPGFDRAAFGRAIVEEWIAAGKPKTPADDPTSRLFDEVVCPSVRSETGEHTRDRSCASMIKGYLGFAVSTDAGRKDLARFLDGKDDAQLADQLLYTVEHGATRRRDAEDGDPFLLLLAALDPAKRSFRAGVELLAVDRDRDLAAEGARLWARAPAQRGSALFLVARAKRDLHEHYGDPYWRDFQKAFGAPIDRAVLASMLEHGPLAVALVPKMWPGLPKSYSRVDVLAPALDKVLSRPSTRSDGLRTLAAVIARLCEDNDTTELAKLDTYLNRRAQEHPDEQAELAIPRRHTAARRCRP